jgi:hypothetical protein
LGGLKDKFLGGGPLRTAAEAFGNLGLALMELQRLPADHADLKATIQEHLAGIDRELERYENYLSTPREVEKVAKELDELVAPARNLHQEFKQYVRDYGSNKSGSVTNSNTSGPVVHDITNCTSLGAIAIMASISAIFLIRTRAGKVRKVEHDKSRK